MKVSYKKEYNMHQSKKEIINKLWNKKINFNIQDNSDKEEFIENNLIATEIENHPTSNNIRNNR